MATSKVPVQLQEQLFFRPKWWWDPVPDWFLDHLSAAVVRDLGMIQMEAQRNVLEAQMKALDQSIDVLRRMK